MNKTFAEYTSSTAFLLALSKRQCNTLLRLQQKEADGHIVGVDSLRGLDRRGLVFWKRDEQGMANGFGGMTKAGELVVQLLMEAGMTIENTNTLSVIGRIERAAA